MNNMEDSNEKSEIARKRIAIKKMGWMVAGAVVFAFVLMEIWFMYVMNIKEISMPTSTFMFMITFYPLGTFFLGMAMIMKKKIMPTKARYEPIETDMTTDSSLD